MQYNNKIFIMFDLYLQSSDKVLIVGLVLPALNIITMNFRKLINNYCNEKANKSTFNLQRH